MRVQEIRLATSGRDQLARSVLNDEWVSHPTWASEEAGFVAHKKNSFEEVIHRCEDERHEYQIQLEGLARTIAILEPLATRLNEMSPEERSGLRLRPDLGGQSRWIYVRTLKKVYGKDAGTEVYQALQDAPAVAVPVILARLKQKNEEWRRAQREWSHTWRQVDARNFYKSLDHTGINFKQNDKKTITTRAFVVEIEGVRKEQEDQAREEARTRARPTCTRGSLGFQLTYSFADSGVLYDALKLVYSYLDHNQATYSLLERRSVERFLRAFMPLLCMLPPATFNAACGPLEIGVEEDSGDEQQIDEGPARTRATVGGGGGGVHAGDLRKKLARAAAQEKYGAIDGGSRVSTPADGREVVNVKGKEKEREEKAPAVWIRECLPEDAVSIRDAPVSTRPFFCNTTFYNLLRLIKVRFFREEPSFCQLVLINEFYIRLVRVFTVVVFTSVKLQRRRSETCTTEVSASGRQSDCGRTWYGRSTGPVERAGTNIARSRRGGQRRGAVPVHVGSVREAFHERAGPTDV
jgi:paired amphipathic helix protein Sin3a